ncbi:MAG: hypothetical protein GX884_04680 [Chloroflexi bacterium]|nr:hypothetical protein [Chloroflexota bacterium]
MTIAEQDEKDVKSIVATNFSKMFEQVEQIELRNRQLAFGKILALNLISIASIGLVIGLIVSLFM